MNQMQPSSIKKDSVLNYLFWNPQKAEEVSQMKLVIEWCEKQIDIAPLGRLRLTRSNGREQFLLVRKDKSGKDKVEYLSKKRDMDTIVILAVKRYCLSLKIELEKEIKSLKSGRTIANRNNKYQIYHQLPITLQHLILPIYPTPEYIYTLWKKQEWITNEYKAENLIHDTKVGIKVRSKSEELIADYLADENELEFVYDKGLYLSHRKEMIYPDFIILNKRTGRIFIWEHIGMLGKADYMDDFIRKNNDYILSGFIQNHNLFYTFEDETVPYNAKVGKAIIEILLKG